MIFICAGSMRCDFLYDASCWPSPKRFCRYSSLVSILHSMTMCAKVQWMTAINNIRKYRPNYYFSIRATKLCFLGCYMMETRALSLSARRKIGKSYRLMYARASASSRFEIGNARLFFLHYFLPSLCANWKKVAGDLKIDPLLSIMITWEIRCAP